MVWANGEFPCGAVVPFVNDQQGSSCLTLHQRFGVNLPACPLPRPLDAGVDAGVQDAGSVDAGPVDAGSADAGGRDAGPIDAGVVDGGVIDGGITDAGSADAGSRTHAPRFASVPGLEATCGQSYAYAVRVDGDAVLSLEKAPTGATLQQGLVTWSAATPSGEFLVSATAPSGERSSQHFTVAVDCPTAGCSTSAASLLPLLALLLRRRR